MINRLIILLVFFAFAISGRAGIHTSRLTEKQLLQIQKSTLTESSKFLSSAGWREEELIHNPIYEYFGGFFDFKVERWEDRKAMDWEGTLLIYYKDGTPTLVVYQTVKDWFLKLQSSGSEQIKGEDFTGNRQAKPNGKVLEFREYSRDMTKRRYSILLYDDASLKKMILSEQQKTKQYHLDLLQGEDFMVHKNFQAALSHFELARKSIQPWDEDALNEIGMSIQKCKTEMLRERAVKLIQVGDSLLQKGKFSESMISYGKALDYDSANMGLSEKINRLKLYLHVTEIRNQPQSFALINPEAFCEFEAKTYETLNHLMLFAKGEGSLNFSTILQFDAEGTNLSHLKMNATSVKNFSSGLEHLPFSQISPSRILNFYIPASQETHFDLHWKVEKIRAEVKLGEQEIENNQYSTYKYNDKIKSFFQSQDYKNGVYKFEVVEKRLNGKSFEDLNLVSLRSNSGPANVLYSLVMPGWGTQAVTDGHKGSERMKAFLISTALSIGCKIYSGRMYQNYQKEIPHPEEYYRKADFSNKLSLIALGFSAGIYLNDIQYVIRKGLQNDRCNKSLKDRLRNGPVPLVQSQLKP